MCASAITTRRTDSSRAERMLRCRVNARRGIGACDCDLLRLRWTQRLNLICSHALVCVSLYVPHALQQQTHSTDARAIGTLTLSPSGCAHVAVASAPRERQRVTVLERLIEPHVAAAAAARAWDNVVARTHAAAKQ